MPKASLRPFLGKVKRRLLRALAAPARRAEERRENKPTIDVKAVKAALRAQLEHAYNEQEGRIPKIIHFCWMGGNEKPDDVKAYIKTWAEYLPEYEVVEWNESNFDLHYNRYVKEAYESRKWAFVSDVVRLYALYEYGGIYLDADVEICKPLDRFLAHKAFSSFQLPLEGMTEPPFIPTGLMASEKGGQWVGELLAAYKERTFILPDGSLDLLTNPRPITQHTEETYGLVRNDEFQDLDVVTLYPSEYFCAKNWKTKALARTENTYAIHHFAGSWL